jgi:hypothetical protein
MTVEVPIMTYAAASGTVLGLFDPAIRFAVLAIECGHGFGVMRAVPTECAEAMLPNRALLR